MHVLDLNVILYTSLFSQMQATRTSAESLQEEIEQLKEALPDSITTLSTSLASMVSRLLILSSQ